MTSHSIFYGFKSDVVKGTLDIQKDTQCKLTMEYGFFYIAYRLAQGHITGVILPEGMLIVMHGKVNQTGLFSLPQHEFLQGFEKEGCERYGSEGPCLLVACSPWFWDINCFRCSPFGGSVAQSIAGCIHSVQPGNY